VPQLLRDSYTAWQRNQAAATLANPASFADVVQHVITPADPLISDQAGYRTGMPQVEHEAQMTLPQQRAHDISSRGMSARAVCAWCRAWCESRTRDHQSQG